VHPERKTSRKKLEHFIKSLASIRIFAFSLTMTPNLKR